MAPIRLMSRPRGVTSPAVLLELDDIGAAVTSSVYDIENGQSRELVIFKRSRKFSIY